MSDRPATDGTFSDAVARIAAPRRLSGPEIVDHGIQLARQHYGALALAALLPMLPYFGIDFWNASHRQPLNPWPTLMVSMLLTTICSAVADAAAARVAMDALEGRSPDPARALGLALRRAWPVAD
ncbi:MAG: hypothetical protein JF589_13990 [Gemmatimonadetes bacterium]|nr:hypothetical protein [Gemmatimonadota bacterium]